MNKRIEWIDIFKSLGIILMIMGHIGFGSYFDYWIHAFHMPMFFFITGYLYKKKYDFKKYLINKAKTLLMPYFLFGIFYSIINYLRKGSLSSFVALFYPCTEEIAIAGALWFLISLFFANMIYFLIDKINNKIIRNIIIIIIALVGQTIKQLTNIVLPFGIMPALVGVGLIHLGRLTKESNLKIENLKTWQWLSLFIISIFLSLYSGYVNMRLEIYPNILMFWIVTYLSIIVCLNIARVIDSSSFSIKTKQIFISIGRNSIIYVIFNQLVLLVINKFFNILNLPSGIILNLFKFILIMTIQWIICLVFDKTKLKILIGKF